MVRHVRLQNIHTILNFRKKSLRKNRTTFILDSRIKASYVGLFYITKTKDLTHKSRFLKKGDVGM